MIENNRNNEQIYGRNDMIMLDQNNKIYGSLGLADKYVMKTEEGTKLILSNPKLGSFDDVLTELNIYGMSKQERTTGAQLLDIKNIGGGAGEIVSTQHDGYVITAQGVYAEGDNGAYRNVSIELDTAKVTGKIITASVESAENDAGETLRLICDINYKKPDGAISWNLFGMNNPITVSIPADTELVRCRIHIIEENEKTIGYGTYTTTIKGLMVSIGDIVIPWEPYTGGQPSPSPDYPQEIKSVVNPIVKVTNEDETESQTVTLPYTLNAIPVSSGGNVTINGQQYIADYVDVERGKLVKKLKRFTISDVKAVSTWGVNENADNITGFYFYTSENGLPKTNNDVMASTILQYVDSTWGGKNVGCAMSSSYDNNCAILSVPTNILEDISSDENACASLVKICENTNAIFFYSMASPIETDLTPEEIEQYKKLRTKAPTTIIENNYNTWMKATYKSTESV